jgi:serine protease Do
MNRPLTALLVVLLSSAPAHDFSGAVRRVKPALVGIYTEKVVAREVGSDRVPDQPEYAQTRTLGSGLIIDTLGHVITCNHVIAGYEAITVKLADGTVLEEDRVRVVGRDPVTDLALLKVRTDQNLVPAELGDSDSLSVGEPVLALGNPLGLELSASAGIVSALSRWGLARRSGPDFQDFIQTDALVNPGNSGGPLVDLRGRVVGICSSTRTGPQGFTGIGFASPINLVIEIARQLIENGAVIRGHLGISTQPLTKALRDAMGLTTDRGILVASVTRNRPGMRAGIIPGDVITGLDNEPVTDVREFQGEIARRRPGSAVSLTLVRQGRPVSVQAVLDRWPIAGAEPAKSLPVRNWLGLKVRNLAVSDTQRGFLDYGVLVDDVESGGPGSDAGIKEGDVIVEMDFAPVKTAAAYSELRARLQGKSRPIAVRLYRGRDAFYTAVEP